MSLPAKLRSWAREARRDVLAIWLAIRDPRTPLAAKLIGAAVVAYAFSPIDLIPDFIPVLGYLDDLIIVPLGVLLVVSLVPSKLMREFRIAALQLAERPVSRIGLAMVVSAWILAAVGLWFAAKYLRG